MEHGKRTLILGPVNANQRVLSYKLPADIDTIFVKAEKSTEWTLSWSTYDHSENNDNTPVEMPIGYQHPESLADQMRRFIRQEVSAAREEDQGSFADEDDFADDDPILSKYELTDMEEVEEILAEDDSSQYRPERKEPTLAETDERDANIPIEATESQPSK